MHAGILHVHSHAGWCLCESPLLGGLNRWVCASLSGRSILRGAGSVAAGGIESGDMRMVAEYTGIPEPSAFLLFGSGALALLGYRRYGR